VRPSRGVGIFNALARWAVITGEWVEGRPPSHNAEKISRSCISRWLFPVVKAQLKDRGKVELTWGRPRKINRTLHVWEPYIIFMVDNLQEGEWMRPSIGHWKTMTAAQRRVHTAVYDRLDRNVRWLAKELG